jgi:hypothetical protein
MVCRDGISGCKESRPELNQLMADVHRRRFDAILGWKIDRFGRSLKHLVNALADLGSYGVAFISLRDNLDLSTPSGRLMFQIIGAMADYVERVIMRSVNADAAPWRGYQRFGTPHNTGVHCWPIKRPRPDRDGLGAGRTSPQMLHVRLRSISTLLSPGRGQPSSADALRPGIMRGATPLTRRPEWHFGPLTSHNHALHIIRHRPDDLEHQPA